MSKSWESPISIIEEIGREVTEAYDAYIVEEVRKVIPHIDQEELVKALEYDRGQYEKGYADGRAYATKHGHWNDVDGCMTVCSSCGMLGCGTPYCSYCGAMMDEVEDGKNG